MIKSFHHKGLERFFETGSASGIRTTHRKRLRMQLAALDTAQKIGDMDIPGFKLHPPKRDRQGERSIWVSGE